MLSLLTHCRIVVVIDAIDLATKLVTRLKDSAGDSGYQSFSNLAVRELV